MIKKKTSKSKARESIKSIVEDILLISPVIIITSLLLVASTYIVTFNGRFIEEPVVTLDDFIDSDPVLLSSYADKFDKLLEYYNLPYNLTGDGWDYYLPMDVQFKQAATTYGIYNNSMFESIVNPLDKNHPLNEIDYWLNTGHGSVYAGYTAVGQAIRYAIAQREKNETAIQETKNILLHISKGFSLLSSILPGGRMARFVCPDTPKARDYMESGIFHEEFHGSHLFVKVNYTYEDKDYTFYCETGTSIDCYMVYIGLGMIYAFCNDTEVRDVVRTTVDRMLTYHVNAGWRFMDYDGKTHDMGPEGITIYPLVDASYAMTWLRIGKLVNPEKWGNLYDSFAHDRLYNMKIGKHANLNLFTIFSWGGGYFNLNLVTSIAGVLCFLEDDPQLKSIYQQRYLEPLHDVFKYHRNAWFDALYYLGMSNINYSNYDSLIQIPSSNKISDEIKLYLDKSIGDCLMRISYAQYPYRRFIHANGMTSFDSSIYIDPIPNAPYPSDELYNISDDFDLNDPILKIIISFSNPQNRRLQPRTADFYDQSSWMWESSPFDTTQGWGNGQSQSITGSYSSPYWIARYLNLTCVALES